MSENESLSMFGKEEEGGGVEVGGMGESGRDTVRFLSHALEYLDDDYDSR